ncbi:MAG: fumarylacetoacetate hydrolase family protein [Defluviitaleaceae bacterium]|nr:fumarylacetoacetate hydrolase family protein [Defluviitaleaceae bacterium]
MRFATYMYKGNEYAGVQLADKMYSFDVLIGEKMSMLDFIRRYEGKPLPDFLPSGDGIPAGDVTLLAPIPYPFRNIFCIGKNYEDHAKEVRETIQSNQDENLIPQSPIYFTKTAVPAMGDGSKISLHAHLTQKADYEAELGVIIGKTITRATREQAAGAIFGYTVINDITARDVQKKHSQWFFGKSLDGFCPIGPNIVSADEIAFPPALNIKCRVNGETRQSSNTSNLIFDIPHIISELSQGITLRPGDIIATGTPAGIGHAMTPPQYLKPGDVVECEIEKIGVLTNYF